MMLHLVIVRCALLLMKTAYVQSPIHTHGKRMNLHSSLLYLEYLWNLIKFFFSFRFTYSWYLLCTFFFFCALHMSRVSEDELAKQWKIIKCSIFIECSRIHTQSRIEGSVTQQKSTVKEEGTTCKGSDTKQDLRIKNTNRTWKTLAHKSIDIMINSYWKFACSILAHKAERNLL